MPHLAEIATPLYKVYKKGVEFTWSPACQPAFDTIKVMLTSPPVLCRPDPTLPIYRQTGPLQQLEPFLLRRTDMLKSILLLLL